MKQVSLGLNLSTKKTRKREFLEQMNKVVPWDVLVGVVEPSRPMISASEAPENTGVAVLVNGSPERALFPSAAHRKRWRPASSRTCRAFPRW